MKVVTTFADAREAGAGVTGLVPTMGYFHEGHLSHMREARDSCDTVLVSLAREIQTFSHRNSETEAADQPDPKYTDVATREVADAPQDPSPVTDMPAVESPDSDRFTGPKLIRFAAIGLLLLVALLTTYILYLNSEHAPQIQGTIPSELILKVGQQAPVKVIATDKNKDVLEYSWSAERGSVSPTQEQTDSVVYTAPGASGGGFDTLTITVSDGRASTVEKLSILIRD